MGLDMYLSKRTYVKNWNHMKSEELHEIKILKGGKPTSIKPERISYIIEEVAYWRKANAIHAWFVTNCQDGVDECQETYVRPEQLQELLDVVRMVLDNTKLANDLLPSQSGFFFGGTDYDEWYIKDLEYTRDALQEILAEDAESYYYRSSW